MEQCRAPGCTNNADVEVILYDLYLYGETGDVFFERDYTCPFLCSLHMTENEEQARGERKPRATVRYPYTNRNGAQGFTIYRPLLD
jgi:hypothetical protein